MSGASTAVSFESDIRPLFREKDRDAMLGRFDLWSYDDSGRDRIAPGSKLEDLASQAASELPDPVSTDELVLWAENHGVSRWLLVDRMGGSP